MAQKQNVDADVSIFAEPLKVLAMTHGAKNSSSYPL